MIIDSWLDYYLGGVSLIRIFDCDFHAGDRVRVMSTGREHTVDRVGVFTPKPEDRETLTTGEVGFVIAGIKDIEGAPVGDTLTTASSTVAAPLPGFKKVKPNVYAGLFPIESSKFESFREALAKLRLNDAALVCEPENSEALGFGFRCGFLGMLHMEIVQERLEREYELHLITTAPTVVYEVETNDSETHYIDNPARLPSIDKIVEFREPIVRTDILVPQEYVGNVMTLCIERRGIQRQIQYLGKQVSLSYELPMSEIVFDFFDRLKSVTRGYGSMDYTLLHYRTANLVRLDLLINGERVDALSAIIHRDEAQRQGRQLASKMKEIIPRQMFEVAIQAAIGSNVLARESVKALRKNVTAKCYGGDISRKRKLLEKQKEGKKRMKQFGSVEIPQEAFMAVLTVGKPK